MAVEATVETAEADGLTWVTRPNTDDHIAWAGHERGFIDLLMEHAPGECFLDVGAHVGMYSLRLAPHFKEVVAVEPHPDNRDVLEKNIALNSIRNIQVTPTAAWSRVETLNLADNGASSSLGSGPLLASGVPLDYLRIPPVTLMKIDVEGAEAQVLKGAGLLLATDRPVIFIELHDKVYDSDSSKVAAILAGAHYSWEQCFEWGPSFYWRCHPN